MFLYSIHVTRPCARSGEADKDRLRAYAHLIKGGQGVLWYQKRDIDLQKRYMKGQRVKLIMSAIPLFLAVL